MLWKHLKEHSNNPSVSWARLLFSDNTTTYSIYLPLHRSAGLLTRCCYADWITSTATEYIMTAFVTTFFRKMLCWKYYEDLIFKGMYTSFCSYCQIIYTYWKSVYGLHEKKNQLKSKESTADIYIEVLFFLT